MSESDAEIKPVCFVIMGFGRKTDFETGRTLDLDKTYENIVKPAAIAAGYRPIRADEVWHSSVIDGVMYEMLFHSELVIADISTANPNAIYELGVRHALRPKSTIVIKESDGRYFFDLNHEATFGYRHLGEDIGATEANRAQRDLERLIREISTNPRTDSPVYTYLPRLKEPRFSEEEIEDLIDLVEHKQEQMSVLMSTGDDCISKGKFEEAFAIFSRAHEMHPNDSYIAQRMVLARYKNLKPSILTALTEALVLLQKLDPDRSNDPESLGLAGSIHKRLWWESGDRPQLEKAIKYYGRGFEIRRDYYNGQNLANCYDIRASEEQIADEAIFYRLSARKTRESLKEILDSILSSADFDDRSDKRWVVATAANVATGLGDSASAEKFEAQFRELNPADWEIDTFEHELRELRRHLEQG